MMDNAGTLAVALALAGLVVWIIAGLRRDKRRGKSACGCDCGCCPMSGTCHKNG